MFWLLPFSKSQLCMSMHFYNLQFPYTQLFINIFYTSILKGKQLSLYIKYYIYIYIYIYIWIEGYNATKNNNFPASFGHGLLQGNFLKFDKNYMTPDLLFHYDVISDITTNLL